MNKQSAFQIGFTLGLLSMFANVIIYDYVDAPMLCWNNNIFSEDYWGCAFKGLPYGLLITIPISIIYILIWKRL